MIYFYVAMNAACCCSRLQTDRRTRSPLRLASAGSLFAFVPLVQTPVVFVRWYKPRWRNEWAVVASLSCAPSGLPANQQRRRSKRRSRRSSHPPTVQRSRRRNDGITAELCQRAFREFINVTCPVLRCSWLLRSLREQSSRYAKWDRLAIPYGLRTKADIPIGSSKIDKISIESLDDAKAPLT
jgi:hypothetical protein